MVFPLLVAAAALTTYGTVMSSRSDKRKQKRADQEEVQRAQRDLKKKKAELTAAQYLSLSLGVQRRRPRRTSL